MIDDPWFYAAAIVAVLIVGVAKGGLGGGIGVVAVPLMAMAVSPIAAAAIMLPILMVMDALALRAYWGQWDRPNLRVLLPASLLGTALGSLTFGYLSADGLRAMVGAVSLLYGIRWFTSTPPDAAPKPSTRAGVFWGATAAFTSFAVHAGGPPLQAYLLPQQMGRTAFQATSVVFFFVVNWSKVGPYAWFGLWNTDNLLTSLLLMPLAPIGIAIGRRLHDRVNDKIFFAVVHASLVLIGAKLLYDASGL